MQKYVARNGQWIYKAQELFVLQESIKRLEKQAQQVKEELCKLSKNKSSCGGGYIYEMSTRKGSVQYAQIPELRGINLEQYRSEPVVTWKLRQELPPISKENVEALIECLYPNAEQ